MSTIHVVTACDHNAYERMLVPFIASITEVGGWHETIHVVDLGLTEAEKGKLQDNNITIIPSVNVLSSNVCDRFSSIAEFFKDKPNDEIYVYDADIWFCDKIEPLFFELEDPYKMICTHDATWQGFLMGCVHPFQKDYIKSVYDEIVKELGYVLQVGFVGGKVSAYSSFAKLQEYLIKGKIAGDVYGTDTLVLNMYYHLHPQEVKIISTGYNCLPDWGIYKEGNKFFNAAKEIPIICIHETSPHRSHGRFSFQKHFREIWSHYDDLLEV